MKESEYADLHLHSTYSFQDGYGLPRQIVQRAKELGRKSVAITDHGNVSSFCDFEKASIDGEIKPVYGCEFYCIDSIDIKEKCHLTVLARDLCGYKSIMKLVSLSWCNMYRGFPILCVDYLFENKEGLVVLSGCSNSKIAQLILSDRYDDAKNLALKYRNIFSSNFYLEIQPFDLQDVINMNRGLNRISLEIGIPLVSTSDVHYLSKDDVKVHKILRAIGLRKKVDELDDSAPLHPRTLKEILYEYKGIYGDSIDWISAIKNIPRVVDLVDFYTIPKAEQLKVISNGADILRNLCESGLKKRNVDDDIYRHRMERELELISKKDFVDYFLIVQDMVSWAKSNGVFVGPSRGSSAGSLVCYLIGITEVDPLRYGLFLERFIDETRTDYPDIDVDFDSISRDKVVEYAKQKYGEGKVALLCSFAEFKGKNSIDEIKKVYDLPSSGAQVIKKFLIERPIEDARASYTIEDTLAKFPQARRAVESNPLFLDAKLLEGQIRHLSTHAAGIVISQNNLEDIVALYSKDGNKLASCDKAGAEYLKMLKIDILSLKALSVIKNVCGNVEMSYNDLINIPLDDEKTFDGFRNGNFRGVFQFDGEITSTVVPPINPDRIDVLIDAVALSKPGPLYSRSTRAYIEIKSGIRKMKGSSHPLVIELTKDTYGQILYQEQVMRIVREIGGFSWEDTTKIRKAISKSMGQEFMGGFEEKFVEGAEKRGVSGREASEIWGHICTHGLWSFNKAHAAGYAILGYWMMYLKQHFPLQFYWSCILEEKDERKRNVLLIDFMEKGYRIYPPHANYSKVGWSISGDGLRAGLTEVGGIGDKIASAIISKQPYKDFSDMQEKLGRRIINKKVERLVADNFLFGPENIENIKVVKMFRQLQHPSCNCKIGQLKWMQEARKNVIVCCFIKTKSLFNVFEEDKIRDINKSYKDPQYADFMVFTLEDATGQIKADVDRYTFARYSQLLWDVSDMEPVLILGDQPLGKKHINIRRIKKL